MTIRKQWITALISIAVITVIINSVLSTMLVNKNFNNYIESSYKENVKQIINTVTEGFENKNETKKELEMALKGYLDSPIIGIGVYNNKGEEEIDIGSGRMHQMMMMNQRESIDTYNLEINNKKEGLIYIRRYSEINATYTSNMFKQTVVINSIMACAIAIVIAIIVSIYMSKRTIKDLQATKELAQDINLGKDMNLKVSRIKEIRFIQENLRVLNSKLKLKQKARKQLLDEMIHQSRTPLTILKTHIEAYQDEVIEMNKDEANICIEQIDNVTIIISNMSEMIENDKEEDIVTLEKLSIDKLINQIENGLKMQFKNKKIDFLIEGENNLVINSDRYKLSQSVYNVLTNAYKFTNEGGIVTVKYFKENNNIKIEIKDTGIGIKENDIERVFSPYYRGGNARNVKGEGIGLYIVQKNIESIGGKVELESTYEVGTKITLSIPIEK